MKKVYIVMGSTGEYSDHQEWLVAAYFDKEKGKEHVEKAGARAREIERQRESRYSIPQGINEYDPYMLMYYTGTFYNLAEVDLYE